MVENRPQRIEAPLLRGHNENDVRLERPDEFAIRVDLAIEAVDHLSAGPEFTDRHAVDDAGFPPRVSARGNRDVMTACRHALGNLPHHLLHPTAVRRVRLAAEEKLHCRYLNAEPA